MLRIHGELQRGRFPNATTLGVELEVNPRTIRRDLEFMRDRLNLPVEWNGAKNGFHYTEEVDAFPTVQITEGELVALLVAEKALQQYRGTPFEKPLVAALEKIQKGLPNTVSLELAHWEDAISFKTTSSPDLDHKLFETLTRAVQKRRRLTIQYRKPNTQAPEARVIDPYHLANVNGDWYLFAHDHLRRSLRTFAVARIVEARLTGETFSRPRGFQASRELGSSFGVHSKEGDFAVVIEFEPGAADYIREKRWHSTQELTELPGGAVALRMQLGSLPEVVRWVLSWGGAARVLQPAELAASVAGAAERLLDRHRPGHTPPPATPSPASSESANSPSLPNS